MSFKLSNFDVFYLVSQHYGIDFWSIEFIVRNTRKAHLLNGDIIDIPESVDLT